MRNLFRTCLESIHVCLFVFVTVLFLCSWLSQSTHSVFASLCYMYQSTSIFVIIFIHRFNCTIIYLQCHPHTQTYKYYAQSLQYIILHSSQSTFEFLSLWPNEIFLTLQVYLKNIIVKVSMIMTITHTHWVKYSYWRCQTIRVFWYRKYAVCTLGIQRTFVFTVWFHWVCFVED